MPKKKIKSYEQAMQELEQIVTKLQSGKGDIDQLAQQVERASELMAYCKDRLRNTEQTIRQTLEQTGGI